MTRMRIRPPAAAPDVRDAALVVGNSGSLTTGDTLLQTMLGVHGLTVTVYDDSAAENTSINYDVVVIAPSADAATLASKWTTTARPMLIMSGVAYWNAAGISTSTSETSTGASTINVKEFYTSVVGILPAGDFSSSSSSSTSVRSTPTTNLVPGAHRYISPASISANTFAAWVEKGAQLDGGGLAANRRVIVGYQDTALSATMSLYGKEVIDGAIRWALGHEPKFLRPAAPITNYAIPGLASDRYVDSANGSDANDGTTATTGGGHGPWQTMTKALKSTGVAAGGTVIVRATGAAPFRERVGNPSHQCTIQPYPGEQVVWLGLKDYKTGHGAWTNSAPGQWWIPFDPTTAGSLTTENLSTPYSNADNAALNTTSADYHLGVQIDTEPAIMRTAANQLDEKSAWYDSGNGRIYVGKDPATCTSVEITCFDNALDLTISGTVLRGILFSGFQTHANTSGVDFGLAGAWVSHATNQTFENLISHGSMGIGASYGSTGLTTSNIWTFASGCKGQNMNNVDSWTRTGFFRDTFCNRYRYRNSNGASAGMAGIKITNSQTINNGGKIQQFGAYGCHGVWFDLHDGGTIAGVDSRFASQVTVAGVSQGGINLWIEDNDNAMDLGDFVLADGQVGLRVGESTPIRVWNGVIANNRGAQVDIYTGEDNANNRSTTTVQLHNVCFAVTSVYGPSTSTMLTMRTNLDSTNWPGGTAGNPFGAETSSTILPSGIGRVAFERSAAGVPTNIIQWLQGSPSTTGFASKTAFDTGHAGVLEGSSVDRNDSGATIFNAVNDGGTTYNYPQSNYSIKSSSTLHNAGEVVPDSTIGAMLALSVGASTDIGPVATGVLFNVLTF